MKTASSESVAGKPESVSPSYAYQVPRAVSVSSSLAADGPARMRLKIKASLLPETTKNEDKTEDR